jgi:hypothetical protein
MMSTENVEVALRALKWAMSRSRQREERDYYEHAVKSLEGVKHLAMQVRPLEFAELIKGKETMTGIPTYWAEWPNKE